MVDEATAKRIHDDVRFFFKWDVKSSNKRYNGSKTSSKATTRNAHQSTAGTDLPIFRNTFSGMTLAQRAQEVEKKGQGGRIGNCYEMALLAGLFASRVPVNGIWIGGVGNLGDHAFCLLGATSAPDWSCAWKMRQSTDTSLWVVDPWANVCSAAPDYYTAFFRKMDQWGDDGKEISFHGKWVNPATSEYKLGMQIGTMSFSQFS